MSKIIGVTVGTPLSVGKIEERIKPIKTLNGKTPDENGNVSFEEKWEIGDSNAINYRGYRLNRFTYNGFGIFALYLDSEQYNDGDYTSGDVLSITLLEDTFIDSLTVDTIGEPDSDGLVLIQCRSSISNFGGEGNYPVFDTSSSEYNSEYSYTIFCREKPTVGAIEVSSKSLLVGDNNTSYNKYTFSSGRNNTVAGVGSVAIGAGNMASGENSFVSGNDSNVSGANATSFGNDNITDNSQGFTVGLNNKNHGAVASIFGQNNEIANGASNSIAAGKGLTVSNYNSAAFNENNTASGPRSFAAGYQTKSQGEESTTLGYNTTASGRYSIAGGTGSVASNESAIALQDRTTASGIESMAIGQLTTASNEQAFAQGHTSIASGKRSVAMGLKCEATNDNAIALGNQCHAYNTNTVAIGRNAVANNNNSVAIGYGAAANADNSISLGLNTIADTNAQLAVGKYNASNKNAMFVVGTGNATTRKNGFAVVDGGIYVGGTYLSEVKLKALIDLVSPKYSVDLSQIQFGPSVGSGYSNAVIIDGTKIYLNKGSAELVKYNDVTSLTICIGGHGEDGYHCGDFNDLNTVSYTMGGIQYTLTPQYAENIEIQLTGDVVITYSDEHGCLTGDTLITMADGTYKRVDEIEVGDSIRAIDPETLEVVADTVIYSDAGRDKTADHYDLWTFSDGSIIKTVHRHRFYNLERQAMVYMDEWNIGEHGYNEKGESIELVSHERINDTVNFYTIFTEKNNYFANGLLSGNRRTKPISLLR